MKTQGGSIGVQRMEAQVPIISELTALLSDSSGLLSESRVVVISIGMTGSCTLSMKGAHPSGANIQNCQENQV